MEETQKKLEEAYLVIAYLQAQLVQKNSSTMWCGGFDYYAKPYYPWSLFHATVRA